MGTVKRVSVLSTGTVRVRPDHIEATWRPMLWWMLTSRQWTGPLPIHAYVIEHSDGLVLFDAGQDRASVLDPGYLPPGVVGALYRRTAQADIPEGQTISAGLARLGYASRDVSTVVLSHLHQDHIGGLPELPDARLLVDAAEWATVHARGAELAGIMARHIDVPGRRWEQVTYATEAAADHAPFERSHDVFGDGTLVLLPTPGHTPGSMSLLVRQPSGPPLVLVGDLTFSCALLDRGAIPGAGEREGLRRSSDFLRQLRRRQPGLVVLAAHDPQARSLLAEATGQRAG